MREASRRESNTWDPAAMGGLVDCFSGNGGTVECVFRRHFGREEYVEGASTVWRSRVNGARSKMNLTARQSSLVDPEI